MYKIVNYLQETGTRGTAAEHVGYLNRNTYYGITGVIFTVACTTYTMLWGIRPSSIQFCPSAARKDKYTKGSESADWMGLADSAVWSAVLRTSGLADAYRPLPPAHPLDTCTYTLYTSDPQYWWLLLWPRNGAFIGSSKKGGGGGVGGIQIWWFFYYTLFAFQHL